MFKYSDIEFDFAKMKWIKQTISEELQKAESVEIPPTTKTMADYALCGCKNLKSVTIPNSVSRIGVAAFCGCESLESIEIPAGVTEIKNDTFYNCKSLKCLILPSTIKLIGETAFKGLKLEKIIIKSDTYAGFVGLKELKAMKAFENICMWKYIAKSGLIWNCKSFDITVIPNYKFIKILELTKDVETIANLKDSTDLQEIINLEQIKNIAPHAFDGCNSLSSITLHVDEIPSHTFENCSLNSLELSTKCIGECAFKNANIKNIVINEIPQDDIKICSSAFECCSLSSVDLSHVKNVGACAFKNCTKLEKVILPDASNIPESAFEGCYNIRCLTFNDSTRKISKYAFKDCKKIEKIDLRFVKVIENEAFKNCFELTELKSDELKIIDASAFANCISLKSVDVSIDRIKECAFEWCINLEKVILRKIKALGDYAFGHNKNLEQVEIYNSKLKKLENTSSLGLPFDECDKLKNIKIVSDIADVNTIKDNYSEKVDVVLSEELKTKLEKIKENKSILEKLDEYHDTIKNKIESIEDVDTIIDIQQKFINNKMKLIEAKLEIDKKAKMVATVKNDVAKLHELVTGIKKDMQEALEVYKKNKDDILNTEICEASEEQI